MTFCDSCGRQCFAKGGRYTFFLAAGYHPDVCSDSCRTNIECAYAKDPASFVQAFETRIKNRHELFLFTIGPDGKPVFPAIS